MNIVFRKRLENKKKPDEKPLAKGGGSMKIFLRMLGSFLLMTGAALAGEPGIVVVYGDSITAGAKLPPGDVTRRWLDQVQKNSGGTLRTVNEGKGGRPTNSLPEFDDMLKKQPKMDLLVVALGANDSRDTSQKCVPDAVENLKSMIARARQTYGAQLPILLVGPTNIRKDALGPSKSIGDKRESNLIALNAAFEDLAKIEKCDFVRLYGVLPEASLAGDGVHPDATGHDAIAKVMGPAITKALSTAGKQ